ncbi:MAG: helix-turn-helix domain-containing protein [Ruminococcus sp.]|nr:helix-turn-helix domain-containing protein [Ruminococcus sp.]
MYENTPNMQIMRMPVGAENPFTVTSNDERSFARDSRLTSSAKGILYTVLSLCEQSWHFSVNGLCSLMKDSETRIRSALKELKSFGYYVTEKIKDEKGRYQPTKHYFYESVQLNTNEDADKENGLFSSPCPRLDFPHVDSPDADSVAQSNTNILNTKTSDTESVSPVMERQTDKQKQETI